MKRRFAASVAPSPPRPMPRDGRDSGADVIAHRAYDLDDGVRPAG